MGAKQASNGEMAAGVRRRRYCPVTGGCATSMTEKGFAAACARAKAARNEWGYPLWQYCQTCDGSAPAELTIISLEGYGEMTSEKVASGRGQCAICGENRSVKRAHNLVVCVGCASALTLAGKDPEAFLKVLEHQRPGYLTAKVPAADDAGSENLERLEALNRTLNRQLEETEARLLDLVGQGGGAGSPIDARRREKLGSLSWTMLESVATGEPFTVTVDDARLLREIAGQ